MFNFFTVYAQIPDYSDPTGENPATIKDLEVIFARIISFATQLAGIGLFIMLVVSGFKLLTSRGDPQKAESARNTMTYAVIGLVLIVVSWLILKIMGEFLNIDLLEFTIPTS